MNLLWALENYDKLGEVRLSSPFGKFEVPAPTARSRRRPNVRIKPRRKDFQNADYSQLLLRADIDRLIDSLPGSIAPASGARGLFHLRYRLGMEQDEVVMRLGLPQASDYAACHNMHMASLEIRLADWFGEWFTDA